MQLRLDPDYEYFLQRSAELAVQAVPEVSVHSGTLRDDIAQLDVRVVLAIQSNGVLNGRQPVTVLTCAVTCTGMLSLPGALPAVERTEQLLAAGNYLCAQGWLCLLRMLEVADTRFSAVVAGPQAPIAAS